MNKNTKMILLCVVSFLIVGCIGKVEWTERKGGDPEELSQIPICPSCKEVLDYEALQCSNPSCRMLLTWSEKNIYAEKLYPEEEFQKASQPIVPTEEGEDIESIFPKPKGSPKEKEAEVEKAFPKKEEKSEKEKTESTEVPTVPEEKKDTQEPSEQEEKETDPGEKKDWKFEEEDWDA